MEFHAVKLFQRVLGQTVPTCLLNTPDTYIMFIGISTYNTCNYIQYLFLQHFEAKKKSSCKPSFFNQTSLEPCIHHYRDKKHYKMGNPTEIFQNGGKMRTR